jgi:signal transduction histidine kinase
MRTLLWELRPHALLESSLDQLIQQLAEAVAARAAVKTQVLMSGCGHPLPPDVQVGLYRIAQETLNNVTKHAHAQHISIDLTWAEESCIPETSQVELSIADDGRGFDPQAVSPARLGLKIMRERARAIGAEVGVHSQPGAGTRVTVRWPIPG